MEVLDTVIVGGGPAGFAAGIYAVRSGLRAIIIDAGSSMAMLSPWIENYPGFEGIAGSELLDKMRKQASEYIEIREFENVDQISKGGEIFIINSSKEDYRARSVIFATGASHKKLGIPGEDEFVGKGVSFCATCDGFFFKDKRVVVVGGGNNAATEAIYLVTLGADVSMMHRRDVLRAEARLQTALEEKGVNIIYETVVEEILGEVTVKSLSLKNVKTGSVSEMLVDGVFISIGEVPNSELARALGVDVDNTGYVKTDRYQRTNVPLVYAAGDLTGGFRQIITACSEGAISAKSAYKDLMNPYWV